MKPLSSLVIPALVLSFVGGCAGSSAASQPTATRRRHRRPRPPAVAVVTDPDAGVAAARTDGAISARVRPTVVVDAFGTPVVPHAAQASAFVPHWEREGRRHLLRCVGEAPPQVPSSQSTPEPSIASVVRAFHPFERNVAACAPPSTPNGRLPVRGIFFGSGVPREFSFPQMAMNESQALCVGRSLCEIRLPVFRSINAQVSYDYVVYLPASE